MSRKKSTRGGKRPGAGRPIKESVKRVYLTAMVRPDTLEKLDQERRVAGKSRGEVIDEKFSRGD